MRKGEIWLVEIPQLSGHEQEGVRPAIVIADTKTPIAIVIPCTSNLHAFRFPFTLLVEPSGENGLDTASVASVFQLRAIDKKRLIKRIGFLERSLTLQINRLLKKLFIL